MINLFLALILFLRRGSNSPLFGALRWPVIVVCYLLALASVAASLGLLYIGYKSKLQSDGPGALLVVVFIPMFFMFALALFKTAQALGKVTPQTELQRSQESSALSARMKDGTGFRIIKSYFLWFGILPLVPFIVPALLSGNFNTHPKATAKNSPAQTLDFAAASAQGLRPGPRWVLSLNNRPVVVRLGPFTPEWVIPSSYPPQLSAPLKDNRYVILGHREVWDLEERKLALIVDRTAQAGPALLGQGLGDLVAVFEANGRATEFLVWNTKTKQTKLHYDLSGYAVHHWAVDPRGRRFAFAIEDQAVMVFDDLSNQLVSLGSSSHAINKLLFSQDGSKLAVGLGTTIDVYSFNPTGKISLQYPRDKGCRGGLEPLGFSRDGRELIATDGGYTFERFALANGALPEVIDNYHYDKASRRMQKTKTYAWATHPDANLVMSAPEGSTQLVGLQLPSGGGTSRQTLCDTCRSGSEVQRMEFSPDGWWLAVDHGELEFWNLATQEHFVYNAVMPPQRQPSAVEPSRDCELSTAVCLEQAQHSTDTHEATKYWQMACDQGQTEACLKAAALDSSSAKNFLEKGILLAANPEPLIEELKKLSLQVKTNGAPPTPVSAEVKKSCNEFYYQRNFSGVVALPYVEQGQCRGIIIRSTLGVSSFPLQTGDLIRSPEGPAAFCTLKQLEQQLNGSCAKPLVLVVESGRNKAVKYLISQ